jgi:SAM-dependent methyltransferase
VTKSPLTAIQKDDALSSRIHAAYDRRRRNVAPDRYARSTPRELCGQHERELRMMSLLRKAGLDLTDNDLTDKRVLEVGCGTGSTLRLLLEYGAKPENLFGIDILQDRVERARSMNPAIQCFRGSGTQLPFHDGAFDLVIQFTTFTSILDSESRQAMAEEIQRVLAPGGRLLWYDFTFNNPWNPDVRGIKPSEIQHLFAGFKITGMRITLAPPLGRVIARISYPLYHLLAQIPLLCTHYVCVVDRP